MDIELFPYRVLGSDTTEKLLSELEALEDVKAGRVYKAKDVDDFFNQLMN